MAENNSTARLETFSDGVFAIAITLLILGIEVPPIDSIHSINDLENALLQKWPSFFAFVYSFGGILVQWIFHHNILQLLNKTSRTFLYTNGFLLLTIVFFPFPTALLAEYINTAYAMPAIVFYGSSSIINAVGWFLFYRSIDNPQVIRATGFSDELFNRFKKSNHLALVIYSSTTLLAIWFPYTGLTINIFLWALWIGMSLNDKQ